MDGANPNSLPNIMPMKSSGDITTAPATMAIRIHVE
jgi:hypothetical protein